MILKKQPINNHLHRVTLLDIMVSIEETLKWVENTIKIGYINYQFLAFLHPFYGPLRKEPRFEELMDVVKPKWESFEI